MEKKILYLLAVGMILFVSCQEEEEVVIDPTIDNTILRGSQLESLMKKVVIHDGSFDDVVDGGNCFSINLPYTILQNGEEHLINELSDYQGLFDTDIIEIQFPITITLFDHSEEIVNTTSNLVDFANMCQVNDDDIECVDFLYPIRLSTFDSRSNTFSSLDIGHDSGMFEFMSNVDENTSVSINYPINLQLHNGQKVGAQHNSDLLKIILDVVSVCDENDN